ncbi:uncharacterized protein LOC127789798 isoform X2 [Diospyros lotus]|uniref:uncharacterized protein LOC127789798 isoform X2 n=1 Tax=Diospyros lotus TaxID=55363 RepID=UPI0022535FBF|nr:uncharacterized protein LOC127789798 isoform X2 [Diospyros lotus]
MILGIFSEVVSTSLHMAGFCNLLTSNYLAILEQAEGFLLDQNLSACYDFVDLFCDCILNHLSVMSKQRECPEECKEAVPSLVFAAARFADLPELRDLRSLFAERYGHSLEAHVNQEFVEKLKALPPTKDVKLQLLQDVAVESDLQWDSKTLEQKLYNAPPSGQNADNSDGDNKQRISWDAGPRRDKQDFPYLQKEEVSNIVNDALPGEDSQFHLPRGKREKAPSRDVGWGNTDQIDPQNNLKSEGNVSEEKLAGENRTSKYRFIPPPYTKPKAGETKTLLEDDYQSESEDDLDGEANVKASSSVPTRQSKLPPGQKSTIGSDQSDGEGKLNSSGTKAMNGGGDDQQDEGKREMDGLRTALKEWSFKAGKSESDLKQPAVDGENSREHRRRSRSRASSLQLEPVTPVETTRGHVRSQSYQPGTGHVHPKLPDYDDFIAKLSALRGKK